MYGSIFKIDELIAIFVLFQYFLLFAEKHWSF